MKYICGFIIYLNAFLFSVNVLDDAEDFRISKFLKYYYGHLNSCPYQKKK